MRLLVAGLLTLIVSLVCFFFEHRLNVKYVGAGTSITKSEEILISLSGLFVSYFYILIPLLFIAFRFLVGLVFPASDKPDSGT